MSGDICKKSEAESFETLNENISVCVTASHGFGTDAFLLADFASPRRKDVVCDLGTGCGIIPMIFSKAAPPKITYGVDIQEKAVEQFEKSIASSKVENEIIPLLCDLKDTKALQAAIGENAGRLDLITCNPPYKIDGGGILSDTGADRIARHETMCGINDICFAAKVLLRFGGRLCICNRPERLADVISAMRENDIEPKLLRFVAKNEKSAPWLFLIEGKKSSKPFMKVLPSLFLYESENGTEYTKELLEIYNSGKS